jgi:hypothetical protein
MMKRQRFLVLVLTCVILTASLVGQDVQHAPTVAQCQADQRLWDSEIMNKSRDDLPVVGILQKQTSEMRDCLSVDPPHQFQYIVTTDEIDAEELIRTLHFLQRHNMMADFKTEDAAGKR